jgi:hypothetical protein
VKLLQTWLHPVRTVARAVGPHARLRVALLADDLTRSCFEAECVVLNLTPGNARRTLECERPDLLFVESAWGGWADSWKYGIAAYPDHPERDNRVLASVVELARHRGIPTVFWNKEDAVHFDRFVASASLFEFVFTVDRNCVPRYRERLDPSVHVDTLPFAVQPAIHSYDGIDPRRTGACFVGSYSRHVHPERRARQDPLIEAAAATLGLTVYDRNSDRRGGHYRYPALPGLKTCGKVAHERTAVVYKSHLASLNVNTVEDSPTMFSRRLIEILACGGLAVTTPARSVDEWFSECCHVVDDGEQARSLFARLSREGYNALDREMMVTGADLVRRLHTYAQRLDSVLDAVHARPQTVPDARRA